MRSSWIALGAVGLAACSSSSSSKVLREGPDAGSNDSGNLTDTGNLTDRGNLGDRAEPDVGSSSDAANPVDAGDGGDSSVATGPIFFEPASVELRANTSAPVQVRLGPDGAPSGTLEVTLTIESTSSGDAGSAPLSLSRASFQLSSAQAQESFQVTAAAAAPQGAYSIRAVTKLVGDNGPGVTTTLPVNVIGRPGELDTTFGSGGYFDYQPEGNCNAEAVVALSDGRFVILGQALTSNMLVARFTAAGAVDNAFGPNGNGRLVVNRGFGHVNAVLLPDGKLLVAYDNDNLINLLKILPNGTVDPSWGANGILPTELSPGNHTAMAVDSGGAIFVGGDYYDQGANSTRAAILRLTPAGAVDTTFAGDGRVEILFNSMLGTGRPFRASRRWPFTAMATSLPSEGITRCRTPRRRAKISFSRSACNRMASPTARSGPLGCSAPSSEPTSLATTRVR